ncbi:MAG: hypothetical protein KDK37_15940, partial [Leptospiraceae bacterium]|nr:hypothetical protein [Leptospiraceae bacterium]
PYPSNGARRFGIKQISISIAHGPAVLYSRVMIEPIKVTLDLPVFAEKAFDTFTLGFGSWWPRVYTWSGDSLKAIGMEPQRGGRCTEVGPRDLDNGRL